jgi:signal transduction histidine kinase
VQADGAPQLTLSRDSVSGRAILERRTVYSADVTLEADEYPETAARAAITGARAFLASPLLKGEQVVGVLAFTRMAPEPYTPQQILIETFADQAVIAIENARLFNELEAKTRELEIASRHKSEFLANMSHELRTPLNAIIGYAELLQEECADLGQDGFLPDLGKIHSAGKHLLTLISGILDLSKVEAGRMTMFLEDCDMASLVRDVESIVRPLVEKNGNAFTIACPADVGACTGSSKSAVLFNVLSSTSYREGKDRARRAARSGGRHAPVRGARHRHRHQRGADVAALRSLLAGRRRDQPEVRRHRSRARALPPVLPDDGRRHRSRVDAG